MGFGVAAYLFVLFFLPNLIYLTIGTLGLSLLLFIAAGWLVGAVVQFTNIAIVDEDLEIFDAVRRAWQVVRQNLGQVIVMALILGIGQMLIGLMLMLPFLLVPVPILLNLIITQFDGFVMGLILSILMLLVLIPVVIFLSVVLTTYVLSCWTLTFRRLKNKFDSVPRENA